MLNNDEIKKILLKQAQGEFEADFDFQNALENEINKSFEYNTLDNNEPQTDTIDEKDKNIADIIENENPTITENKIFDENGFDEDGFDGNGFNKDGFDKNGFDGNGFNKDGFDEDGFDENGFNKDGFDKDGFDENGFNKDGFDKDGFDENGFNKDGFDKDGFDENGFNKDGFDKNGFDGNGFNKDGFDKDGFDENGFNKDGFDKDGFNKEGRDIKGYNKNGFNKSGFDRDGYDADGYNWRGIDRDGYDKFGFDIQGYDKNGFNMKGFNKEGYDKNGYDWNGYDKDGYNVDGFDKDGFKKIQKAECNSENILSDLDYIEQIDDNKDNEENFMPENLIISETPKNENNIKNINWNSEEIFFNDEKISITPYNSIIKIRILENYNNDEYRDILKQDFYVKEIEIPLKFSIENTKFCAKVLMDRKGQLLKIINAEIKSKSEKIVYSYTSNICWNYRKENKKHTITAEMTKDKLECFEIIDNITISKMCSYKDIVGYTHIEKFKNNKLVEKKIQNLKNIITYEYFNFIDENGNSQKTIENNYQFFNDEVYTLKKSVDFVDENSNLIHEYFEAFSIKELPDAYKNNHLESIIEGCPKQSSVKTTYPNGSINYSCMYSQIDYSDNSIYMTKYVKDVDGYEKFDSKYTRINVSPLNGELKIQQNKNNKQKIQKYMNILGQKVCVHKKIDNIIYISSEYIDGKLVITKNSYYEDKTKLKNTIITQYIDNMEKIVHKTDFDENGNTILDEKYVILSNSLFENNKIYVFRNSFTYFNKSLIKKVLKEYNKDGNLISYIANDFDYKTGKCIGETIKEYDKTGHILKLTQKGIHYKKDCDESICIETYADTGKKITSHTEQFPIYFSKLNIGEMFLDINLSNVYIIQDEKFDVETGEIYTELLIKNNNSDFAKTLYKETKKDIKGEGILTNFELFNEYGKTQSKGVNVFQDPRGFMTWDDFESYGARLRSFAYKIDSNGNIISNTKIPMDKYNGEYEDNYSTLIEEIPNDWALLRKSSQNLVNEEPVKLKHVLIEEPYFGEKNNYSDIKITNISLKAENENVYSNPIRTFLIDNDKEYIWKKEIINPKYNYSLVSFLKKDDSSQKMYVDNNNMLVIEKRTYKNPNYYIDEKSTRPIYSYIDNGIVQYSDTYFEETETYENSELIRREEKNLLDNGNICYSDTKYKDNLITEKTSFITDNTFLRILEQTYSKYNKIEQNNLLTENIVSKFCNNTFERKTIRYNYINSKKFDKFEMLEKNNKIISISESSADGINAFIDYEKQLFSYTFENKTILNNYQNHEYKFLLPHDVLNSTFTYSPLLQTIICDCWYLTYLVRQNKIHINDMIKHNYDGTYTVTFKGNYTGFFELFISIDGKNNPLNITEEELNNNIYEDVIIETDDFEEKLLQLAYIKLTGFKEAKIFGFGQSGINLLFCEDKYHLVNIQDVKNLKDIVGESGVSMNFKTPMAINPNVSEEKNVIVIKINDEKNIKLFKNVIYQLFYDKSDNNFKIYNPVFGIKNEIIKEDILKSIGTILIKK